MSPCSQPSLLQAKHAQLFQPLLIGLVLQTLDHFSCPPLDTFAPCNDTCSDDRDCPLEQKCCFTGCSLGCLDPEKPGNCPPEPIVTACSMESQCGNDSECPEEEKCCSNGCGQSYLLEEPYRIIGLKETIRAI
uniref:WAP domain-containing protein n=1 Tax=Anolis carolinensis TaxID=28377 RepID=A0A803TA97_ANOCA